MRLAHALLGLLGIAVVTSVGACGGSNDDGRNATAGAGGSGGHGTGGTTQVPGKPVKLDPSAYTYKLTESRATLPLWTTPASHKPTTADRPPDETGSGLRLSAARGEYEPVQLLLGPVPGAGSVKVDVANIKGLSNAQSVELSEVTYESGWGEHRKVLASGSTVTLSAAQPTPVWLTVFVPRDAPAGDHTTQLTLTPSNGAPIKVPVTLHVFDFELPKQIHFGSQLNINIKSLIPSGGKEQDVKDMLFAHRFTPKSVTWPSGFTWKITWENKSSPTRCQSFYDEPDESAPYSIGHLAPKYILGQGWNGVGFPNAMLFQFVNNSTPRPDTFCGVSRGDDNGTATYNAAWGKFLAALDGYLVDHKMDAKAYYYVQNEPQNAKDEALAAHLCRLTKKAAPHLRIAISEEPKPSIAEDPGGACGYDIWIAHIRAYQQDYAWKRQRDHGEQVWFYSLDHDPDPYFNPTRVDTQGMHERIIPWVAWSHRIRGWAYYDAGRFFDGATPGVRAELLREGFEDYEYLWLANGKAHPRVFETEQVDKTVRSVASSMTNWNKSPDALMALRDELGKYIEGSRDTLPILEVDSGTRKRGAYYLNFQDPKGKPSASPLVVGEKTYMKIGWSTWDDKAGFGWSGEHVSDPGIAKYGYDDVNGYSEVQRSYLYDDYGRNNVFEFALENGTYAVTIGVGRPRKGYPNDPHRAIVEGIPFVDDEPTSDAHPVIERTKQIELTDGSLTIEVGGKSPTTNDWAYTFLAYVNIEPADKQ